jgi:hypothetical protein
MDRIKYVLVGNNSKWIGIVNWKDMIIGNIYTIRSSVSFFYIYDSEYEKFLGWIDLNEINNFIQLSEWREKQIKSILDD